jgi:hypothetical protein
VKPQLRGRWAGNRSHNLTSNRAAAVTNGCTAQLFYVSKSRAYLPFHEFASHRPRNGAFEVACSELRFEMVRGMDIVLFDEAKSLTMGSYSFRVHDLGLTCDFFAGATSCSRCPAGTYSLGAGKSPLLCLSVSLPLFSRHTCKSSY